MIYTARMGKIQKGLVVLILNVIVSQGRTGSEMKQPEHDISELKVPLPLDDSDPHKPLGSDGQFFKNFFNFGFNYLHM